MRAFLANTVLLLAVPLVPFMLVWRAAGELTTLVMYFLCYQKKK